MIKFDAFINAIHAAILSANDALVSKNLDVLDKFFEVTEDNDEFKSTIDEALTAINNVLQARTPGTERLTRQKVTSMLESVQELKEALSKKSVPEADIDQILPDKLKPKMTTIQFPQKTDSGVVMCDVRVPLITLVPLSMTQISEVQFRTELEIQIENDELLVSFTSSQSETPDEIKNKSGGSSHATLQITLTPHHGTEGLRKIVEGYEKILRGQIPS
ncbi:MAG: DUF2589 domain-containing protein [Okeania sp. SIO3H1]|uniref:DUF2589 domain-containing protein n=1 Tax=Okeania sp. SIO1I7 TaxID=2607772 RepID=UPI0013CB0F04|nr:DUF2589 domain-containing protein [Okeania sp. SIO1I7]NEN88127.1 DUF2589 domain-containing protein [Okeania sp. SIO3H1]NET26116.1 DUF2589 domain-containing protein [Okeania sp. SIO1I7]